MNELQPFDVLGANMRFGSTEDGTPYVVAADFARALDYRDAEKATRLLDEDEKGTRIVGTPGGDQQVSVLYEDGIWELVFLSRKPEAKLLKKRVKAILRELRETGSYAPETPRLTPLEYAERLVDAERRAEAERRAKEQVRAELEVAAPKADSWDVLASADGDHSVADAAKNLSRDPGIDDLGQNRLYEKLSELGWIFRGRGDRRWRAYQAQVDCGRLAERVRSYDHPTSDRRVAAPQVRITTKGLHELHRLLGGERPLMLPIGGVA